MAWMLSQMTGGLRSTEDTSSMDATEMMWDTTFGPGEEERGRRERGRRREGGEREGRGRGEGEVMGQGLWVRSYGLWVRGYGSGVRG